MLAQASDSIQLTQFEFGIIRRKVRQLVGCHGFRDQDREQLEQELISRLLQGLKSFDPQQAHRNAFATTIVERSVATIIRHKRAEKRDHRRVCSLNAPLGNCNTELGATIGQDNLDSRRCRQSRSATELSDLANDVAELIASLPPDLRQLAEALKHKPIATVAREMGIPRTSLRERVLELRARFEAADMRFHL